MLFLIVDDDRINRKILENWLEKAGHQTLSADDGREALEILDRHPVEMILSGAIMPVMDGYQLCRQVRKHPTHGRLPFVFHTSTCLEAEDEELAYKTGADGFIRRSAHTEEFIRELERVIGETTARARDGCTRRTCDADELFPLYGRRLVARLVEKVRELEGEVARLARAGEELTEALDDKDVLLREVHHRVKNNMQVISSLLSLQADRINDRRVTAALRESRNRVAVMALIHETLHQTGTVGSIDMADYIARLVHILSDAYGTADRDIEIGLDVEPLFIPLDHGIPCGLALNELISNALEHAFPKGGPGEVHVRVERVDDDQVHCSVRDNGRGFPPDLDWRRQGSLGLTLVHGLIERQLGGRVEIRTGDGTEFTFTYPL